MTTTKPEEIAMLEGIQRDLRRRLSAAEDQLAEARERLGLDPPPKPDEMIEGLLMDVIRAGRARFYQRAIELEIISKEQAFSLKILHIIEDTRRRAADQEASHE